MNPTLADLAAKLIEIRNRRKALEAEANRIKKEEEEVAEKSLMLAMSAQGVKTANLPDIGKVVIRESEIPVIQDYNLFCQAIVANIVDRVQTGAAWSDGVLFQKRVNIQDTMDYVENRLARDPNATKEAILAGMGLGLMTKQVVAITKN